MKKPIAAVAALAALSLIALLGRERSDPVSGHEASPGAAAPTFEQRLELERAAASPEAKSGISPAAVVAKAVESQLGSEAANRAPATLHPPSMSEVRDEVSRNPHTTPASIIRFAQSLAPEMEAALENESDAQALQPKLAQCAKSAEIDSTAALCLVNSKRLADRYASLRQQHAHLVSEVRPTVSSLERSVTLATQ